MVNLGDEFPNFEVNTTKGKLDLHAYFGKSWGILFSHPSDFTPVCTTELGTMAKMMPDFEKANVKVAGLSCSSLESHFGWIKDIQAFHGLKGDFPFPMIADESRELAVKLGMVDPVDKDSEGIPLTCRAVFIVGPEKKLMLSMLYPATTGRDFSEILRAVKSLQLTVTKKVATPANWQPGGPCMVIPAVKDEEIPLLFPKGVTVYNVPSGKRYLRMTPQPDED
ncbi:peroxiredoxin-6-like [Ornithodoros turicata]|uniref:peroxiredoxin-6-like n=1 Tax=Ornithodoros turicata TaxID=34597 RepID=UPI003139C902